MVAVLPGKDSCGVSVWGGGGEAERCVERGGEVGVCVLEGGGRGVEGAVERDAEQDGRGEVGAAVGVVSVLSCGAKARGEGGGQGVGEQGDEEGAALGFGRGVEQARDGVECVGVVGAERVVCEGGGEVLEASVDGVFELASGFEVGAEQGLFEEHGFGAEVSGDERGVDASVGGDGAGSDARVGGLREQSAGRTEELGACGGGVAGGHGGPLEEGLSSVGDIESSSDDRQRVNGLECGR